MWTELCVEHYKRDHKFIERTEVSVYVLAQLLSTDHVYEHAGIKVTNYGKYVYTIIIKILTAS